jgi:hypothetical protein
MIYKNIKTKLLSLGFELESIQTGSFLHVLSYIHPVISGEIFIEFSDDNVLPSYIDDTTEFSYDDEWVNDLIVGSVQIHIDKGIYFIPEEIADSGSERNHILLNKRTLYLFDYVMDIMIDPLSDINFQIDNDSKRIEFNQKIKTLLPFIIKEDVKCNSQLNYLDESTVFGNYDIIISYKNHTLLWFSLELFTWKQTARFYNYNIWKQSDNTHFNLNDLNKDEFKENYDKIYNNRFENDLLNGDEILYYTRNKTRD